jgi:hypothetical protein
MKHKQGYFRIVVRPKREFVAFRTQDVGKPGGIQRLTGRRPSGPWGTHTWLLSKEIAHLEKGKLVPDTREAAELLATFSSEPVHQGDDLFQAT